MNTQASPECDEPHLLLPGRNQQLYYRFWHVATFLVFGFYLTAIVLHALQTQGRLGPNEIGLVALLVVQIALYIRFVMFGKYWHQDWRGLAFYFVSGTLIVLVQQSLGEPNMRYLLWAYFGQALGLLPPLVCIPYVGVLLLTMVGFDVNWDWREVPAGAWIGYGFAFVATSVSYLFVANVMRTSRERADLIIQLETARRELEQGHQRETELATLRERERIARDMHDNLGHTLVSLSVQLEAAQRLYRVDAVRASAQMDAMKAQTRASMDSLRRTIAGLRTPGLGDRTLRQALHQLSVQTSQQANLQVSCHVDEAADHLPATLSETLWSATEEALTNITKHAHARHATIDVRVTTREVVWSVCDDGIGMSGTALTPGHYGLIGMRERVEGVGGTLTIASKPNTSGTQLTAHIPLNTRHRQ